MIDRKIFRKRLSDVVRSCELRGFEFDSAAYLKLEAERKKWQVEFETRQAERKAFARQVAKMPPEERQSYLRNMQLKSVEAEGMARGMLEELEALLAGVPNLVAEDVPHGSNEDANLEIRSWDGKRRSDVPSSRSHGFLGKAMGMYDSVVAAHITGARFSVLYGDLAKLQRALSTFMLDVHTTGHGYQEVYVPYIVNGTSLYGTGQLPKFKEDLFALQGDRDWFLIPTAEVALANLCRNQILDEQTLPKKWVSLTPCFRSEAGSSGKDTAGLIRQHQFEKVELVQVVHPDQSWQALEEITGHAEKILQMLDLRYRVVTLCAGDLGFSAAKTYDIEVWMPAQNRYREISSCSNTMDFQARRLMARYRDTATGKPVFVHMLNASGLAVGRTLAAVIENYQQTDESIRIPEKLVPYMDGQEYIKGHDSVKNA